MQFFTAFSPLHFSQFFFAPVHYQLHLTTKFMIRIVAWKKTTKTWAIFWSICLSIVCESSFPFFFDIEGVSNVKLTKPALRYSRQSKCCIRESKPTINSMMSMWTLFCEFKLLFSQNQSLFFYHFPLLTVARWK